MGWHAIGMDGTYRGSGDEVGVPGAGRDFDIIVAVFLFGCLSEDVAEDATMGSGRVGKRTRKRRRMTTHGDSGSVRCGHTDIWKRAQISTFCSAVFAIRPMSAGEEGTRAGDSHYWRW